MEKRALIFGASGFVGAYLSRELRGNGYAVFGTDIARGAGAAHDGFRECDILDAKAVQALVRDIKPTHIANLAAVSSVGLSWEIPQKTIAVNTIGALNILEATRQFETGTRILLVGSSEEYAQSDAPIAEGAELAANSPYGISKIAQESISNIYRKRYGMKICHVRPFNHTGIGQPDTFVLPSWCKQAAAISRSGKPGTMHVGNLAVKRDFSDVRDIARAYRMVMESDDCETVYNIGSGAAHELREILDYIISLSTQPIAVDADPSLMRAEDAPVICCDNSRIRSALGWRPERSVFDTAREMFEEYARGGARNR